MKRLLEDHWLFLVGAVLLFQAIILLFFVIRSGLFSDNSKSGQAVSDFSTNPNITANNIRRIRVLKGGDSGKCIDITNDGAVRIYETCDGELEEAFRSNDSRTVHRLFRDILLTKMSTKYIPGATRIDVETDRGTYTYYLLPGDGQGDDTPGIEGLIDTIINDNPYSTPTPTVSVLSTVTPIISAYPTATILPSPTINAWIPTPSPELIGEFTCDFSEITGGKIPYRVSNFVCSSAPTAQ
jgi:hypothetical protein